MEGRFTVLGFLVAPLVASTGIVLLGNLSGGAIAGEPGWILLLYVPAFIGMCVFALPLFLLLLALKMINWRSCAFSGFVVGGSIEYVVGMPDAAPVFGLIGAASALSFWAIRRLGTDEGQEAISSMCRSQARGRH